MGDVVQMEPWKTKREIAEHFGFSLRTWERKVQGAPGAEIFGRTRYRVSEVERWLQDHGLLTQKGER